MKSPLNPTPYHQKWALFVVLTASLGFTISMNPDHFNNIARHEVGSLHTVDLASSPSQPEARSADSNGAAQKVESSSQRTPPGEKDSLPHSMYVRGNGRLYEVTFSKENQEARASFRAVGNTEGQSCPVCGLSVRVQSSLDRADDLATEMTAIAEGRLNAAQSSEKSEEKIKPQKKGEATEVDLAKWAEKCDSAADDAKLDCHKNRLIELSKYLKNSSETDSLVREYFRTYMLDELKHAFGSKTIKETSFESCEGQIVYVGSFGRVGCQSDELDRAGEIADDLMNGLRAGNGKSVVSDLTKMRAGSFSAQLRNSQRLAIEGQKENNMAKFTLGFRGMDPTSQTWLLNQMNSNMLDSVQSMEGTSGQKSLLDSLIQNNFYSPVNAMLMDMRNFLAAGNTSPTAGQTRSLLDYQINPLGYDGGGLVPGNSSNPGYTSGLPGNVPVSLLAARMSAPVRASNLSQLFGGLTSYPQSNVPTMNSFMQQPSPTMNVQPNFLNNMQPNTPSAANLGRTANTGRTR